MQALCLRKSAISIIGERKLHLLIKARVASHTNWAQKTGFQQTIPWYLGNNTSSGWCGNYTPCEHEKFSPGTYWLHLVCILYKYWLPYESELFLWNLWLISWGRCLIPVSWEPTPWKLDENCICYLDSAFLFVVTFKCTYNKLNLISKFCVTRTEHVPTVNISANMCT